MLWLVSTLTITLILTILLPGIYHFNIKHSLKISLHLPFCFLKIHLVPQLFLYRCYLLILNTTGNDEIEMAKIGIHIQRKAMHRDPPAAPHTNCTDLSFFPW